MKNIGRTERMKISRVYRLLHIITLLQSGRSYSAAELARELCISRRTVFRDLNSLELARIPYYFDLETKGFRISPHFFLQPLNLTLGEALSLLVMATNLRQESSLPLLSEGAKAAAKIEGVLPVSVREYVGSIMNSLSVHLGPMASHDEADENFDLLSRAIIKRFECRLNYESFYEGRRISVLVHPLRLMFIHRAWYLLAWSPAEKALRTYKLIRIHDLELRRRTFKNVRKNELENYFGMAWSMIPEGKIYRVHLHFSPKVAGNVAEVRWHRTQEVRRNNDGSLEFFADVDGINEISWWVMGYGDQVKVVDPPELRRRIAEVADNVVKLYRQ
ncbi:MAG TPA: WYL domain-containing protein [Phycisphaerae bacterium]|nr:WYL domain-containing protein [Phycisphaerae bacterium]HPS52824.1 WYL domain-containing protein [Phycisphaerae bacterium]